MIITNLGVFEIDQGISVVELANNVTKEQVINHTEAELIFN
jgi:acyl CoA:acetate/3-ketoacid CoA transferase beta subunit